MVRYTKNRIIYRYRIPKGGTTKKDGLISLMEEHAGRITTKQARDAGFSSSMLQLLTFQDVVVRESRGVFTLADVPPDDFAVIALRWPRVVFRCSSALYLHGMVDIVPDVYELSLPQGYKPGHILREYPGCLIHHENSDLYGLGVVDGTSPTGTRLRLYDKERSICDLLAARKRGEADAQLLGQAMRSYFGGSGRNLPQLSRYAKAMGLLLELQTYLEVLS